MRGCAPEIRQLVRRARRGGWMVELTAGDHVRFRSPAGVVVVSSQTPSDNRTWKAVRARLRRAGLEV